MPPIRINLHLEGVPSDAQIELDVHIYANDAQAQAAVDARTARLRTANDTLAAATDAHAAASPPAA